MSDFVKKLYKSTKKERVAIFDYAIFFVLTLSVLALFDMMRTVDLGVGQYFYVCAVTVALFFVFHMLMRLHKTVWEYAVFRNFVKLAVAVFCTMFCACWATIIAYGYELWYVSFYATDFFVCYTMLMLFRFIVLYYRAGAIRKKVAAFGSSKNTMIIGAGWTGSAIAKETLNNPEIFYPVCFLDDDFEKNNKEILDIPIVGKTDAVAENVEKYSVKKIIFAIPNCDREKRKRILQACVETKCELKVVPPIQEMIDKADIVPQTRDVRIEDLLGREPMIFDTSEVRRYVTDKVCLVTGGGGSIGSELCRQIASFSPKRLVIMDIYENNAYEIQQELIRKYGSDLDLHVEICSIADYDKCKLLFDEFRPDLVFHAAAHKHVPLMETVPEQAVKNNIVGTYNLCRLAAEFKVKKFLLISTDKAVNPTNIMGASKRVCEMIVKYHAQTVPTTVYCAVRFGNVLGSNGSVIPLFKRQIAEGGPITITDKRIIRYFMTIPEAVSLVLETGALSQSGEIFVLDMGEPVKILDLAENMIRLSGLEVGKDIEIEYTGLRPGEKLFEELLISGEGMRKTSNKKIFICKQIDIDEKKFIGQLNELISLAKENKQGRVISQFKAIIPNFVHKTNGSVDLEAMTDACEKQTVKAKRAGKTAAKSKSAKTNAEKKIDANSASSPKKPSPLKMPDIDGGAPSNTADGNNMIINYKN